MPRLRAAALLLACLAVLPRPAAAQYFSLEQNKIQYRAFHWLVLRGPHVDLYYYAAERELAPAALSYAEASYDVLSLKFGHEVTTRIPIIVYASHVDYEQTNVLPFTPPEALLGATDFLKRRVSLPFRGNFAEFRHTLRHEMVHVFQIDIEAEAYLKAPRASRPEFPLWWNEGLAELWSAGEDARDEMVLRDLVLSGRMPTLQQLAFAQGGLVYPIGGRIHRWLADTYGDWRVALLYSELNQHESFEAAIAAVYGKPLAQLNEEWQLAMRRAYYPTAQTREPLPLLAREVAHLAVKPTPVAPDSAADGPGDAIYVSPSTGWLTVFRKRIEGGSARGLITGGRSAGLENFHPFDSRMDASRRGYLLLSARYHDRDALVVWNVRKNKLAGRYQFPELVSVLSPRWMPDGTIVFSGLAESGVSDLYRLRLPGGGLEHLTDDRYQDLDPSPNADGSEIVFASDRTAGGLTGAVNLFVLDVATGKVRQLTSGQWVDETPVWKGNRIYYTSSRDGVLNIFSCDTTGATRRETSAWTGAFDAEPVPGRDGLLVSGFHNLSWNVYYYGPDSTARAEHFAAADSVPPAGWAWLPDSTAALAEGGRAGEPYHRRYTLDLATGDIVFVPGFGGAQGAAFIASDLLGDNAFVGTVSSYQGRELGSLLSNLSVVGIYINQTHRLNWGLGAFRTKLRNFEGDLTVAYDESAVGGIGLLRYPLSVFDRVEGTFTLERSDRVDFTLPVDEPRRVGVIASHYLSFVHDNSLFIPTGPIDGERFSATVGLSNDFSHGRFDGYLLSGDWRKYLRLTGDVAYALRGYGFYAGGDRPRRVNLGGTLGLRGYPEYGYIVGSRAWMVNQELRFPLLRHLTLGTPAGDLPFPGIQGALFFDVGKATFEHIGPRATLGSWGASFRMALAPLAVIRLDWGRRFSSGNNGFEGYSLTDNDKHRTFVHFFFGYNY